MINKIKRILKNEHTGEVLYDLVKTSIEHPYLMFRENSRFLRRWLLNHKEKPGNGLNFEHHSHSNFSDGPELSYVVDLLFDLDIKLWSLTDHNNSVAFDSLVSGEYNLTQKSRAREKYELQISQDRRHLTIYNGTKQLVLLRSIEKWTDKGEINVHGYSGKLKEGRAPLLDVIKQAQDQGGFVVINHPYFWEGIGYYGRKNIDEAIENGAIAIEKNATEIPPQIYCPVKAELDAKRLNVPLLPAGDSHKLHMYGGSGITFDKDEYDRLLKINGGSHPDTIKELILRRDFKTYFNYLTPKQFLDFFKF